ncbi:serine/arginine-rich splicing factor 6 [Platysternon megacephalum]|uniref:Serine/arginine-rich splicing factor 6 n=1 Tax=Platysternon megacephalum TaxID=55544 RepID=A0A4D9EGE9_9SAUR|nr:serine/arginine-rich splicing factor 6 [Platysternon megacephalum]
MLGSNIGKQILLCTVGSAMLVGKDSKISDALPKPLTNWEQVHRHLDQHEVKYLQFAFRWMNNLLMREVPLKCTIRLWDTYQSEPEGFSHFHLYVCAAFLVRWRKEILEERDFQVSKYIFIQPCR